MLSILVQDIGRCQLGVGQFQCIYFNKMEWSAEGLDSSNANQLQKRLNNLVLRGDHNGKKLQASF